MRASSVGGEEGVGDFAVGMDMREVGMLRGGGPVRGVGYVFVTSIPDAGCRMPAGGITYIRAKLAST